MAFVNEYISEEDRKKYGIDEINQKFIVGGTRARDWTIDKARNIYLRNVSRGREEFAHQSRWTFFWSNELIIFELENISTSGKPGEDRHGHKRITSIEIPEHLSDKKEDIYLDLKNAFKAYKDGGVFSTAKDYQITLEFPKGV